MYSGSYTSPGHSEYRGNDPRSGTTARSHISAAALIPNGKILPSKWDDAERWITSPLSGKGSTGGKAAQPARRGMKSNSGPLRGPGVVSSLNQSPLTPKVGGGNKRSFVEGLPHGSSALVPRGSLFGYDAGTGTKSDSLDAINSVSNLMPKSQEQKLVDILAKEEKTVVSKDIDYKDMVTQMSYEGSTYFLEKGSLLFSSGTSSIQTSSIQTLDNNVPKDEIWEVEVHEASTTITRPSRKQELKKSMGKNLEDIGELSLTRKAFKATQHTSKLQREEAKITAWENLQKAKASEAIQKLEMKLEKKRLASTKKIMKKLSNAQNKAKAMRNALSKSGRKHKVHATLLISRHLCCT